MFMIQSGPWLKAGSPCKLIKLGLAGEKDRSAVILQLANATSVAMDAKVRLGADQICKTLAISSHPGEVFCSYIARE